VLLVADAHRLLVPSQAVTVTGIVLTMLWSMMETTSRWGSLDVAASATDLSEVGVHNLIHWSFFLLWLAFIPQIRTRKWQLPARLMVLSLLGWCGLALLSLVIKFQVDGLYGFQVAFLVSLIIFLMGALMERMQSLMVLSVMVRRLALCIGALSMYAMTLRVTHILEPYSWYASLGEPPRVWVILTIALGIISIGLLALLWPRLEAEARRGYAVLGYCIFALVGTLFLATLFMLIDPFIRYICFNLLHLGVLVWLVYAGYSRADRFQVNIAFLFFGVGFLTLYFDTFWALLQRSYFFMGAGILLLGGGFLLERNRRKLVTRISGPGGEVEA
jgi:hypothetical protein